MIYSIKQFEELNGHVNAYDLWVAIDSQAIRWEELCKSKYLTKETKSEIITLIEETNDWREVKKRQNINELKYFLQKYPYGRFKKQAIALLNYLKNETLHENDDHIMDFYGDCCPKQISSTYLKNDYEPPKKETFIPCNEKHKESLDVSSLQLYSVCKYKEIGFLSKIKRLFREKSKKTSSIDDLYKKINAAIFAPSETKLGDYMIVQVFLYNDDEEKNVVRKAVIVDSDAVLKNYTPLAVKIKNGDKVSISLNMIGNHTKVWGEKQELTWQGFMLDCQFAVQINSHFDTQTLMGTILLSINDAPVGQMIFKTNIVRCPSKLYANNICNSFHKIFISYSHKDESHVKFIAEGYKALGIDYFFDRHYLKAGDIYPLKIKQYIDSADLFILCWSKNAAESEYVTLERNYALSRARHQVSDKEAAITIYPVSIEPRAAYPQDMNEVYHFVEL